MLSICPTCQKEVQKVNGRCPECGELFVNDNVLNYINDNNNHISSKEKRKYKNSYLIKYDKTKDTSPEVKCPKCGSKQIQAVNKKWSLLSGFLTNKTQRFCLNCKHKF